MRRTLFALLLLLATGWAMPSQAQWWGGGRPCFGFCRPWMGEGGGWARPRRFVALDFAPRPWAGPGDDGLPRFGPAGWGWGWRRWAWRREIRLRRFEAWRQWAEMDRQAASPERDAAVRPHVGRWVRWSHPRSALPMAPEPVRPSTVAQSRFPARRPPSDQRSTPVRAETAVAMMPVASLRFAQPRARAAIPSRVLAAAAMMRRMPLRAGAAVVPAALPVPEPPVPPADLRPSAAAVGRLRAAVAPVRRLVRPVALRSQPAPAVPPAPDPVAPARAVAPAPATPEAAVPASPADVPVAPLD